MTSRVLYAHSVAVIGGAERVSLAMARGLRPRYAPVILAPSEGSLPNAARELAIESVVLPATEVALSHPIATLRTLTGVRALLRSGVDIVHTADILALRTFAPMCRWLNVPIISHMHFPYSESFMRWVFGRWVQPDALVFCSGELRKAIGPTLACLSPHSAQHVIHNGVDTDYFTVRGDMARRPEPRVGIVANLQRRKGHEDFLNMASILGERGYTASYHIIGGDILAEPRRPALEAQAQDLGLGESVVFHGQLDDVRQALADLDIVVCASHEEAFPISMLEAMACGKAIVSTDVNGIPEALTHEENALLVKPGRPDALADAVSRLLDNDELVTRLAQNARNTVERRFSQAAFCGKVEALYRQLLNT